MPNTSVWGNANEDREANQDLISLGNEIIEIADIADSARKALKASNKDGASSIAIEAEGQVKVTAVSENNPASKGLDINNESTNLDARGLEVSGRTDIVGVYDPFDNDNPTIALKVENTNDAVDPQDETNISLALETKGSVKMFRAYELHDLTLGMESCRLEVRRFEPNTIRIIPGGLGAQDQRQVAIMNGQNNNVLHVEGNTTLSGNTAVTAELGVGGASYLVGAVKVGPNNSAGEIDSGGIDEQNQQDLHIGAGDVTGNLELSKTGKNTKVKGSLQVEGTTLMNGLVAISGNLDIIGDPGIDGNVEIMNRHTLTVNDVNHDNDDKIAAQFTNNSTNADARALKAVGKTEITGDLIVGDGVNAGHIDAGGNPNPQDINIGAGTSTADVNLGQAGQDVNVIDDIKVGGDANIGPTGSAGKIDSGGSALSPQDLKIGSASETNDLELSRSGQSIKAKGQLVMNSNNLIMDNSSALTSGSGFVYNAKGSGSAGESIDVYIGGVKVGYFDANGFH